MTSIFICNELIDKLHIFKHKPLSIKPCYIYGQLYRYNKLENVFIDKRILNRSFSRVFGYVLTFDKKHIDYALSIADSYNSCSFYRYGIDNPNDITIRRILNAYIIEYSSFEQLCVHKYETVGSIITYVWLFSKEGKHAKALKRNNNRVKGDTNQCILRTLKETK